MATTGSEVQVMQDPTSLYEKIEERDKELDDLNEHIRQAHQEQEKLQASNNVMFQRLEALTKQVEQMAQMKVPNTHQGSGLPAESLEGTASVQQTPMKPPDSSNSPGGKSKALKLHGQAGRKDIPPSLPKSQPPEIAPPKKEEKDQNLPFEKTAEIPWKPAHVSSGKTEHTKDKNMRNTKAQPKENKEGQKKAEAQQSEKKDESASRGTPDEKKTAKSESCDVGQPQKTDQSLPTPSRKVNGEKRDDNKNDKTEGNFGKITTAEQAGPASENTGRTLKKTEDKSSHVTKSDKKQSKSMVDGTDVRPEHTSLDGTKNADHYFDVVSQTYKSNSATNKPQSNGSGISTLEENSKLVSVMHTNEEPQPSMYLFKFHASVSQTTIDGRKDPSRACAIISMLFAQKFNQTPTEFPTEYPIKTVPDRVFRQVEEAIREGNLSHELNYKGQLIDLGPEEVIMMTKDYNLAIDYSTDVDTRELDQLVPEVMRVGPGQAIMFIKNYRVVSLVPCNNNTRLLLFDSHSHIVITEEVRKMYGAYLFYAKKEEQVVKDLFMYHDLFCDPKPFYGKLVIFNC